MRIGNLTSASGANLGRTMNRKKKLLLNTGTALMYQLTAMVCGFVIPKVIIPYFGSAANGLIDSIAQFLSFFTLCDCGVGAVVQAALYKPLAEKDDVMVSKIMKSANTFFGNVQKILFCYIAVLLLIYPIIVRNSFGFIYTATLIAIMAFNYLVQYYLFMPYRLLLTADQMSFVRMTMHSLVWVLNTVATVVLVKLNMPLHVIKLVSLGVLAIQPVTIKLYVDKHYRINPKIVLTEEPIQQKWNGLAQHVSSVVLNNTDTIVLTLFSSLENVSIYSVYNLVATGLKQVVITSTTGVQALLGNMYVKKETETLMKTYAGVEVIYHFLSTTLFTICGVLLIPFVSVYAKDFGDADYIVPLFGTILMFAQGIYCIRLPYITMVNAAGHFKQTQTSAIVEACLNLAVSIVLVWKFGLVGVAAGTLFAMAYRTCYLVWYLSRHILHRSLKHFGYHLIVDAIVVVLGSFSTGWIELTAPNYWDWILMALKAGTIITAQSVLINLLFYYKTICVMCGRKKGSGRIIQ